MDLALIAYGTAHAGNLEPYKNLPEFRKATINMTLAAASFDEAFAQAPYLLESQYVNSAGLVLGSSYGELGTTISFLEQLSQSQMARPLLFQNSLHNSTLGFLTMRLKLQGPAMTVSNSLVTGENCIELAATLLNDKALPYCVVTAVDSIVTGLHLDDGHSIGSSGEGAATLIVTTREQAQLRQWPALAYLKRIEYHQASERASKDANEPNAYHSDAIEKLIGHLRSGVKANTLTLRKPNGSRTIVHLEHNA